MVSWSSKQILDPIATTAEIFGGDVMNWVLQYHNDVDLGAGDPLGIAKIATETIFRNGKLRLADSNNSNKISFIAPDFIEDKEITIPSTMPTTDEMLTRTAMQVMEGKSISGLTNAISDIPSTAFSQITQKAKLPLTIAYKDEPIWLTDFMVAAHTTTKIKTLDKLLLNPNILYKDVSNDLGDNFVEFGDIGAPSNPPAGKLRLFYSSTTGATSVVKSSGEVVNLEQAVDINNTGFVPLTKGGVAKFTGNGIDKVFTIPHGLTMTADSITVDAASIDAMGSFWYSHDSSVITVTYAIAPPSGATDNIKLQWGATTAVHAASSFAAGGEMNFTGTGAQTVFNIPHGLTGTTPESYFVDPKNAATANAPRYYVTADNTNVIITFVTAPSNGAALLFTWGAGFVNQAWEGEAIGALAQGGKATLSGTGTQTIFRIPHLLAREPESYFVNPCSTDARGSYIVDADDDDLIITYPEPPVNASNNLVYVWGATYIGGLAEPTIFTPGTTDTFTNKTIGDYLDFTVRPTAPSEPSTGFGRFYIRTLDANNEALCCQLKIAGEIQEVVILP